MSIDDGVPQKNTHAAWMGACKQANPNPRMPNKSGNPFGMKLADKRFPGSMDTLNDTLHALGRGWGMTALGKFWTTRGSHGEWWGRNRPDQPISCWFPLEFKCARNQETREELRFWYGVQDAKGKRWFVMGVLPAGGTWHIERTPWLSPKGE